MKDEELKAAAERQQRLASGEGVTQAYRALPSPYLCERRDCDTLVAAYLAAIEPHPLDDWHDDDGFALWWKFPVHEPPYVGSPTCLNWPGHHTHWTPIPMPMTPKEKS